MKETPIEWTHYSKNAWQGCTPVHEGCDHCYAEYFLDIRFKKNLWGENKPRLKIFSFWKDLKAFQKTAAAAQAFHTVFVGSMQDIFEKSKPLMNGEGDLLPEQTGDLRDILFARISNGEFPNLVFLFLTKRPSNINKMIPSDWKINPPVNVWFGCSIVNQKTYLRFRKMMQQVNGNTFYSMEPQLDEITLLDNSENIDWIIQGGESGPKRRPFNLTWARTMKQQCQDLNIPYFFKQIDKVKSIPVDLQVRAFPDFVKNQKHEIIQA